MKRANAGKTLITMMRRNKHVAEIGVRLTFDQLAIGQNAATDTRANRDVDKVFQSPTRSPIQLTDQRTVHIGIDSNRHIEEFCDFVGNVGSCEKLVGEIFDTCEYRGIIDYDPSELVLTARGGTRLSEIHAALAEQSQYLAFEPPSFGGDPTIGGVVATGLGGPRRWYAGAPRDFVLGAGLMTAGGDVLNFGGRVMKNVAGFDVSRLLCGSLGILGFITHVSLRVLPQPAHEESLRFALHEAEALETFNRWATRPLPLSASAWFGGSAWVRLSGLQASVRAACASLGGERLREQEAAKFWTSLRDQTHSFLTDDESLWRFSLPSTTRPLALDGETLVEWGGALRWWRGEALPARLRATAAEVGGTVAQWHGGIPGERFHPLARPVLHLHRRLKAHFDPQGIYNRDRLVIDL